MKRFLFSVLLCLGLSSVIHGADNTVFNHVPDGFTELDGIVHETLKDTYSIVDFSGRDHRYVRPAPIAGVLPTNALGPDGKLLSGRVLVVYVITSDGRAVNMRVIKSTSSHISEVALNAMQTWRFEPGRIDDRPVSTTAAQEFWF